MITNELTISDCLLHMSAMLDNMAAAAKVNEDRNLKFSKEAIQIDNLGPTTTALADVARRIYQSRRARAKYFPDLSFGEPAWDMLLDLFINTVEHKPISVTSLSVASGVPPTTALRYIDILIKEGSVQRVRARHDARVCYVRLTSEGFRRVASCLREQANATQMMQMNSIIEWTNKYTHDEAVQEVVSAEEGREMDEHVRV